MTRIWFGLDNWKTLTDATKTDLDKHSRLKKILQNPLEGQATIEPQTDHSMIPTVFSYFDGSGSFSTKNFPFGWAHLSQVQFSQSDDQFTFTETGPVKCQTPH